MTKPKADFSEHLTVMVDGSGVFERKERVIKGTEHLQRFASSTAAKGLATYGTKKIKGMSCLTISKVDVPRLPAGWRVHHIATHYAYIVRESD